MFRHDYFHGQELLTAHAAERRYPQPPQYIEPLAFFVKAAEIREDGASSTIAFAGDLSASIASWSIATARRALRLCRLPVNRQQSPPPVHHLSLADIRTPLYFARPSPSFPSRHAATPTTGARSPLVTFIPSLMFGELRPGDIPHGEGLRRLGGDFNFW